MHSFVKSQKSFFFVSHKIGHSHGHIYAPLFARSPSPPFLHSSPHLSRYPIISNCVTHPEPHPVGSAGRCRTIPPSWSHHSRASGSPPDARSVPPPGQRSSEVGRTPAFPERRPLRAPRASAPTPGRRSSAWRPGAASPGSARHGLRGEGRGLGCGET